MSKIPISSGMKKGFSLFRIFKLSFLSLFLIYLIISISLTAYQERDFNIVVKELGEEFYNPIQTAQEYSIKIQEDKPKNFISSIWSYWGFYFNVYKIYLWISIIMLLIVNFLLKDSNPLIIRLIFAILIFLCIQLLFFALILKESPNNLFIAFSDIFKGIVYLFTNFSFGSGSESIINIDVNNSCNQSICVI